MNLQSLATISDASKWASGYLKRDVSESNISYLLNYGKVKKYGNGTPLINIPELKKYYESYNGRREVDWKQKLGNDLNWALSFDNLREKDTTKHVHRLHPYKGKFIPQLVEYFLDDHTDEFKKQVYFKPGDIILDPFAGSGTTLVQANELGIHAIGIDVSKFNCMISETKMIDYDFATLNEEIWKIRKALVNYESDNNIARFEYELLKELAIYNQKHFPSPEFKYQVVNRKVNESEYGIQKEREFLSIYNALINKYKIQLNHQSGSRFLDKWYITNVRKEIEFIFSLIKNIEDKKNKKLLAVILSRTIRSCRATTHSDLATLRNPQLTTYYCFKHKKICKPLFSVKSWFERYAVDTFKRVKLFQNLKKDTYWSVISADSRNIDVFQSVKNPEFQNLLSKKKITGIFTSPPYVGQIDYHEQHAYAYDLFGFEKKENLEIGPLSKGKGFDARNSYVEGVSQVLINSKRFLADNYDVFLVANDRFNLYPVIADRSGMKIVDKFKRPVLNRTERDREAYSETIFHLKSN